MKKYLILLFFTVMSVEIFAEKPGCFALSKFTNIVRNDFLEQIQNELIKTETRERNVSANKLEEINNRKKETKIHSVKDEKEPLKTKGYIGLTLGVNFPVGKFAKENYGNARTGLQLNLINFGYLFTKNIGISATWFGAANPIKGADSEYVWSRGGLLIGPLFSLPVSKKVDWDIRPMVGVSWADITNIKSDLTYSFAFKIETGFRVDVSRLFTLIFDIDYSNSKYFMKLFMVDEWGNPYKATFTIPMNTVGLRGGIAFKLK